MKSAIALPLVAVALLTACHAQESGRSFCTAQTVGRKTGFDTVRVTLLIPKSYNIRQPSGGVLAINPKCDFALSAIFANDAVYRLIAAAKDSPLIHEPSQSNAAEADLEIWKFKDRLGEIRFFVTNVSGFSATTTPPKFADPRLYSLKRSGS